MPHDESRPYQLGIESIHVAQYGPITRVLQLGDHLRAEEAATGTEPPGRLDVTRLLVRRQDGLYLVEVRHEKVVGNQGADATVAVVVGHFVSLVGDVSHDVVSVFG